MYTKFVRMLAIKEFLFHVNHEIKTNKHVPIKCGFKNLFP